MESRLLVLSMDAMVNDDITYLRTKPNFLRIFDHCSFVENVKTIYPSITYPAHVSIITGCLPGKHGIFTNGAFKTEDGPVSWHLWWNEIQKEDIFASAKRAGLSTAAVYWPVTGGNPNIDYLINEYFFPDRAESVEEGYSKFGANEKTLSVIREYMSRYPSNYYNRHGKLKKDQTYDDFIIGCVCGLIRSFQPDILFAHNCFLDTLRHRYGVFNECVREGLDQTDIWLGEIADALEDAGLLHKTNFVLLSDHGQMNYTRRIRLNTMLVRDGFIELDNNGNVKNWLAFSQSNGMSATVFLKNPGDAVLWEQVYADLQKRCEEGVWGFSRVYTRAECTEMYGLSGNFAFLLETDGYSAFDDSCKEPVVIPNDLMAEYPISGSHGYEPEKGPRAVFLAKGPSFKKDYIMEKGLLIDEAPTFAKILGQDLPQADGKSLDALLQF